MELWRSRFVAFARSTFSFSSCKLVSRHAFHLCAGMYDARLRPWLALDCVAGADGTLLDSPAATSCGRYAAWHRTATRTQTQYKHKHKHKSKYRDNNPNARAHQLNIRHTAGHSTATTALRTRCTDADDSHGSRMHSLQARQLSKQAETLLQQLISRRGSL